MKTFRTYYHHLPDTGNMIAPTRHSTPDPHHPHDLTLEIRRDLSRRLLKRDCAWLFMFAALVLLSLSLGALIAAANNALVSFAAALILLAGLKSAHYLLTRH